MKRRAERRDYCRARQRAERLAALLDELDRTDGPLPADPEEDSRLDRLLGVIVSLDAEAFNALAAADAGSTMIVDAHVVALAVEAGGGVVVTGDEDDLFRLSGPYHNVAVERI